MPTLIGRDLNEIVCPNRFPCEVAMPITITNILERDAGYPSQAPMPPGYIASLNRPRCLPVVIDESLDGERAEALRQRIVERLNLPESAVTIEAAGRWHKVVLAAEWRCVKERAEDVAKGFRGGCAFECGRK